MKLLSQGLVVLQLQLNRDLQKAFFRNLSFQAEELFQQKKGESVIACSFSC